MRFNLKKIFYWSLMSTLGMITIIILEFILYFKILPIFFINLQSYPFINFSILVLYVLIILFYLHFILYRFNSSFNLKIKNYFILSIIILFLGVISSIILATLFLINYTIFFDCTDPPFFECYSEYYIFFLFGIQMTSFIFFCLMNKIFIK